MISIALETMRDIHEKLQDIGYRITGLTAVNLYGYAIATNVLDIAVASDNDVKNACERLSLPFNGEIDPFIYEGSDFLYRIQGDILGEPVTHASGLWLHDKNLLLKRLEIYSHYDPRILTACAFIALTQTDTLAKKYKYYWNRL